MRKFIYQSIVDRLKEIKDDGGESIIKHFDLWNNNLEYVEEEQPFLTPAVFVELQPVVWRHQGKGVREAAVNVVLHVITQRNMPMADGSQYAELSLTFFDLLTEINCCLYGYAKTGEYFGHDALTGVQSVTDHDCGELRHDVETFSCHAVDASAMPNPQKIKIVPQINI
jgi:hypothetical protein